MYFKFLLFIAFIFNADISSAQVDLLKENILKYNHVEIEKTFKVDSAKLFYNLKALSSEHNKTRTIEIIKLKPNKYKHNFFFYLLGILFMISLFRYNSNADLITQLTSFSMLNIKSVEENSTVKFFILNLVFVFIISYIIYIATSNQELELELNRSNFISILILVFEFFAIKYLINYLLIRIFNLSNKIDKVRNLWIDFMYIFVSIVLPIILFTTIINAEAQTIVISSIFILFIIMYLFVIMKIFVNNFSFFTNNLFKFITYIYIVELIPVLLLVKYLFSMNS